MLVCSKYQKFADGGRCISTDRYMQSSIRVMPCCFITGQAAGIAAAVCVNEKASIHSVNIRHVQDKLIDFGAYLPNCSLTKILFVEVLP